MNSEAEISPVQSRRKLIECPSSSSATEISGNEDLLSEILRRLPAKTLLRFRTVSKHWLSLISRPTFTLLWTRPKSQSISGLLLRRLSHSNTPNLDYIPLHPSSSHHPFTSLNFAQTQTLDPLDILQSCNGFLLCSTFQLRHHSCNYYVYNPTTNKFTTLPRPVPESDNRIVRGVALAFDPLKSAHYKVICVFSHSSLLRGIYWVQIYCSQTRIWVPYDDLVLGPFDMVFDKGVFWNNSVNWLSRESDTSLCFDVVELCCKTIPMPPLGEGEKERSSAYFGESRGHLHLVVPSCGYQAATFDVYEMALDCSEWFVRYRADLGVMGMEMEISVPLDCFRLSVLSILCGEIEDELILVMYIPGKAICYDLKDKSVKKLYDVGMVSNYEYSSPSCRWVIGHQYIESLVCV